MTIQVLISAMYQTDKSLINKTNIRSDVLVINQCDTNSIEETELKSVPSTEFKVTYINTTDRGLSKSRNLAIRNATADICLICDDDEILEDDYLEKILNTFENFDDDVIVFRLNHPTRSFRNSTYRIGFFRSATVGSWQIAFRRNSIIRHGIQFNEKMGSGTGNGSGEENRFIMDCLKKKLKIRYVPELIGSLVPSGESQWFHGYDKEYWVNRGWQSKMIFGKGWGYLYLWYYFIKRNRDTQNSRFDIIKWMHKGYALKR